MDDEFYNNQAAKRRIFAEQRLKELEQEAKQIDIAQSENNRAARRRLAKLERKQNRAEEQRRKQIAKGRIPVDPNGPHVTYIYV